MKFLCSHCNGIIDAESDGIAFGQTVSCTHCQQQTEAPKEILAPRSVINDFAIEKMLASGGMGTVYLAHQITLDRATALKILKEKYARLDEYVNNFVREARSAAKLNHPNIVQAYAVGQEQGYHYFAMEFVKGETLQKVLDDKGKLPLDRGVEIMAQIADAIDFAWDKQKMVHRDIKPDNIMLTDDGVAKLADLGLAQLTSQMSDDSSDDDIVMGTPYYICPESLIGAPVDNRSDLYSLGATFYYALTGEYPFDGESALAIAARHLNDELRPASEITSDIPESVSLIINKLMEKNPDDRYRSGKELNIALTNAVGSSAGRPGSAAVTDLWACKKCNQNNHMEDRYCIYCGASGFESCPMCEKEIKVGCQFCSHCGGDVLEKKRLLIQENQKIFEELATAIKDYDTDNAVAIVTKLRDIDEQTASEIFPDTYPILIDDLRKQLETEFERAKGEYDIGASEKAVDSLIAAFGKDDYVALHEELTQFKKNLSDGLFQAKIAMSANYLTKSLAILEATEPWIIKGADTENRRESAISKCKTLLEERSNTLRMTEVKIRTGNFAGALEALKELLSFKRAEKIANATPAPGDIEFSERLSKICDMLSKRIEEIIPEWIENDKWDEIILTVRLATKVEILSSGQIEEKLKLIKLEIVERYNAAVKIETDGDYEKASEAWERFSRIHKDYLPINQKQYADGFIERRQKHASAKRHKLIKNSKRALFALWAYPLVTTIMSLKAHWAEIDPKLVGIIKFFLPVIIQFSTFLAATFVIKRRIALLQKEQPDEVLPPQIVNGVCVIAVISPISYTLCDLYALVLNLMVTNSVLANSFFRFLVVLIFWILLDVILSRRDFRNPTAYRFSISWFVAVLIVAIAYGFRLDDPTFFSGAAVIHACFLVIMQILHSKLGSVSVAGASKS